MCPLIAVSLALTLVVATIIASRETRLRRALQRLVSRHLNERSARESTSHSYRAAGDADSGLRE